MPMEINDIWNSFLTMFITIWLFYYQGIVYTSLLKTKIYVDCRYNKNYTYVLILTCTERNVC